MPVGRMRSCRRIRLRDPAACLPGVCLLVSPKERAWGMPGAQCTRSLVCESGGWNAHEYSQRVHRKTPGIPTQWFTAYSALSPVTGFLATVAGGSLHRLDTSIGVPGPHGFAVRVSAFRQGRIRVHRIPARVRDDRETPLSSGGTGLLLHLIWVSENQNIFSNGARQRIATPTDLPRRADGDGCDDAPGHAVR